ncbi:MAG: NUDIX hydrolase [Anaerolineales bacterium]|nr:NUDIX hydrolase [Anaerolineales bacterium]
MAHIPQWLAWAREIHSLSQSGLTYSQNGYDLERYRRLQEIAAEIVAAHSEITREAVLESFAMQPGYITPKVDVRAAVIQDGKILLVQERADDKWSMPGGWADVGENPSSMVAREVREESGFEVNVEKVIGVYDANRVTINRLAYYHAYKLVFLCSLKGGQACTSNETLAVAFFSLGDLPPLSTNRTTRAMLAEAFAHRDDPARSAAFD